MTNHTLNKTLLEHFKPRQDRRPIYPPEKEIGIEIEVEGTKLALDLRKLKTLSPAGGVWWVQHDEGSLRGGIEYVLSEPIRVSEIKSAIQQLKELTFASRFRQSLRTSVHIHINVFHRTLMEIYAILAASWLLEGIFTKMNGHTREGNLFCLRSKDAETIILKCIDEIHRNQFFMTWGNEDRYAAINLSSLSKFGSIEYRFIRGLTDLDELYFWVENLYQFTRRAIELGSPKEIYSLAQRLSSEEFLGTFTTPEFVALAVKACKTDKVRLEYLIEENLHFVYELVSLFATVPPRELDTLVIVQKDEDIVPRPEDIENAKFATKKKKEKLKYKALWDPNFDPLQGLQAGDVVNVQVGEPVPEQEAAVPDNFWDQRILRLRNRGIPGLQGAAQRVFNIPDIPLPPPPPEEDVPEENPPEEEPEVRFWRRLDDNF